GDVIANDHRIKVKTVSETPNDRQLEVARRRNGASGWSAGRCVGVSEMTGNIIITDRSVRRCRAWSADSGARRNTQVERVDEFVVCSFVNADLSGLSKRRNRRESQDQMGVRVHSVGFISGKVGDGCRLRRNLNGEQNESGRSPRY